MLLYCDITYVESFKDKCPLGCPCDNYDCDLPEKKAILALYSRDTTSPVLIKPNGNNGWQIVNNDHLYNKVA